MENFFHNEEFCNDLEDLIRICDLEEDDAIFMLDDNWCVKIENATLEPMFKLDPIRLLELIFNSNEERLSDDDTGDKAIVKAFNECIDFEKLNSMIPKLYYPNNKYEIITKQDLLEFIQ